MDNISLALMCGIDIPVPELQLVIHQPKIKEIAFLGEENFFSAVQCLEINKNMLVQDKTLLETTTNFQIFMTIMQQQETKEKRDVVKNLLSILFPGAQISFTNNSIFILKKEQVVTIDEENFDTFQSYLKKIFCFEKTTDQASFNPANEKAREIAEKIMRGRQRVAELNSSENKSIFSQYLSSLTIGLNTMSLFDLMELTMYQIYDLQERYSLYMNWDIDIRSRLAGATPDDKPDNWMKNIH